MQMPRLKITSRAKFYSGSDWMNWINADIVKSSNSIIVRNVNKSEMDEIRYRMNQNHDHPDGEFYISPANSNDHSYVDYYMIYRNPATDF
jgi:hypothetical protein